MLRPPCLNFAVYTVHMRSYMLPSRSMGSWVGLSELQLYYQTMCK